MNDTVKTYWGIITDRQATVDPVDGSADPATTEYAARATNTQDVVTFPLGLPTRRVSVGARVIPAEINDPCVIQFRADGSLILVVFEGVAFKTCEDIGQTQLSQIVSLVRGATDAG